MGLCAPAQDTHPGSSPYCKSPSANTIMAQITLPIKLALPGCLLPSDYKAFGSVLVQGMMHSRYVSEVCGMSITVRTSHSLIPSPWPWVGFFPWQFPSPLILSIHHLQKLTVWRENRHWNRKCIHPFMPCGSKHSSWDISHVHWVFVMRKTQ